MKVSSTSLGKLATGFRTCTLELTADAVRVSRTAKLVQSIPLSDVRSIASAGGLLGASIRITTSATTHKYRGLPSKQAGEFAAAVLANVKERLWRRAEELRRQLRAWNASLDHLFAEAKYIAHFDIETWRTRAGDGLRSTLDAAAELIADPLMHDDKERVETHHLIERVREIALGSRQEVRTRNAKFVEAELRKHQTFFNTVESTPLTQEQRVASVVLEDRNLLVAAAGSGKTSTIVAKAGHALLSGQYKPSDILVLAFNNNAAKELDERINKRLVSLLPHGAKIRCSTFHALGLAVVANGKGVKPSVAAFATGSDATGTRFIEGIVADLLRRDIDFAVNWLTFRALYGIPAKPIESFQSRREWDEYVRAVGDYRSGRRGFLTLKGDIVKSQGELAIANWLFVQGVLYEYERPYEHNTATAQYRQYSPDFYFPDIGAYLEHYGIDAQGNPPPAFAQRYKESMQWKAALHQQHQTDLITTTFGEFIAGTLFPKLKAELKRRGQEFKSVNVQEVLAKEQSKAPEHLSLLRGILKHAKSNEVDRATMEKRAAQNPQPQRARIFTRVFWKVFDAYEAKLKAATEVDFEDMIIEAARLLEEGRAKHAYRLILVDEFQDISQARAKLLKALLNQVPECRFFAVGDDWQSVYRFAGADIDVFTDFAAHFGVTATNYLTATFRANAGISNAASWFVQRNPKQLRKKVIARDSKDNAVVVLRRYVNFETHDTGCLAILEEIAKAVGGHKAKRPTVFLLARYRHQCPSDLDQWIERYRSVFGLSFRTIHSSKGLEADYVVILGMAAGKYSFPSTISDDPLYELVMPHPENFEHAEERRLFYVAMTRARRRVYLLAHSAAPSSFVTELFAEPSLKRHLVMESPANHASSGKEQCPACETGLLSKRSGKFGEFWGCSNYPICRFTRDAKR